MIMIAIVSALAAVILGGLYFSPVGRRSKAGKIFLSGFIVCLSGVVLALIGIFS